MFWVAIIEQVMNRLGVENPENSLSSFEEFLIRGPMKPF